MSRHIHARLLSEVGDTHCVSPNQSQYQCQRPHNQTQQPVPTLMRLFPQHAFQKEEKHHANGSKRPPPARPFVSSRTAKNRMWHSASIVGLTVPTSPEGGITAALMLAWCLLLLAAVRCERDGRAGGSGRSLRRSMSIFHFGRKYQANGNKSGNKNEK